MSHDCLTHLLIAYIYPILFQGGELDCKSLGEDKTSTFPSVADSVASAVSLVKNSTNEVTILSAISILLALTGVFIFASKTEKKFNELEEQAIDPATMAA